jgi:preprotein translocase subunit SecF
MKIKNRSGICLVISGSIILIALLLTIFGHGINLGLDFTGGLSMQYNLAPSLTDADEPLNASAVQNDAETALSALNVGTYSVTVQGAKNNTVNIRLKGFSLENTAPAEDGATATDSASKAEIQKLQSEFVEKIHDKYPEATSIDNVNYVGPVAGATLVRNAILSVLLASALMLIYIAIRFDLNSGLAAVFGLLHDVLIMLSFMVIFRSVIQMNSSFIAAALTIVGYSINNTIVIFDRIRENARKLPTTSCEEITNISIRESLGRTICTTVTTLITIVALCILGVASIREFALPIIVGILSGVYSANMINGYVWAFLEEKRRTRKASGKSAKAKA